MATLYITEYDHMGVDGNGVALPIAQAPSLTEQTVAIGASSAPSAAFQSGTRFIRVAPDVTCSIKFGAAPTAVTTSKRLYANTVEYFAVPQGQSFKVAVIANS